MGARFRLLGSVEAQAEGQLVEIGSARRQCLLAVLLADANRFVSTDQLVDRVWRTEQLPKQPRNAVHMYVSLLRRALSGVPELAIVRHPHGYAAQVDERLVDMHEFRLLVQEARVTAGRDDGHAIALLEKALGLWRGEAFAALDTPWLASARVILDRERQEAERDLTDLQLRQGRHGALTARLAEWAGQHPLDERLAGQLMLALYRSGRQADALAHYQLIRAQLAEDLGIDASLALQELHQRILTADPALAAGASSPAAEPVLPAEPGEAAQLTVRYSLPPDTAAFTGRDTELDHIIATVTGTARAGGAIAVHAIGGMPGMGKTALAVHAAHLLCQEFPDRQLFIDLHAHTPGQNPVEPGEALAGLLAATGVDPRFLPDGLDGRAAMWRDRMAGQRALLVLDNAASSAQAVPLLPGGGGCLVLVTSRRHLGDLPGQVTPVLLDALPAGQAAEMFTRLAPRAAADPAGVAQVMRLAGCLPLAVSLLARVLARHPSWTVADLAAETRDGLLALAAENDSVAAAFEVSYRHLDPARQRLFRLLGLHPGTTTDAYAAAALAGVSLSEAAGLLDGLHAEGLVTETVYRRYGMHDLLRRYARDHAAADPDHNRALSRLLEYYQRTAARAQSRLARQSQRGPAPAGPGAPLAAPALDDAGQALAWARADRDSLLACLDHLTRAGQHAHVVALTAALAELLHRDGPWTQAITRHAAAAQAAGHLGDPLGQAGALTSLGYVRQLSGDYPQAGRDLEQALALYRDVGDRLGQAGALTWRGGIRYLTGDYPAATRDLEQALALYRDLGDRLGQASALTSLGYVRQLTSDYPGATRDLMRALALYRDLGDFLGQANALTRLGIAQLVTGDWPQATRDLEQALALYRDLGDRLGQANALTWLGDVRRRTGDYPKAGRDLERALALHRDLGNRLGQANALTSVGDVRRLTGDWPGAARDLEQALALYRDIGSTLGQASALTRLGTIRRLTGDLPAAAGDLERALALYRNLGDRGGEAEALNEIGILHRTSSELTQAGQCHQKALELARAIASDWDEASALVGLGRCAIAAGQPAQARTLLQQAYQIFQQIGAADAPTVLADLNALRTHPRPDRDLA